MLYLLKSYIGWDIGPWGRWVLPINRVPVGAREERARRYGSGVGAFHVTLITPPEFKTLRSAASGASKEERALWGQQLLASVRQHLGESGPSISMTVETAMYVEEKTGKTWRTYFLPVHWEEAQAVRAAYGLPEKALHVSLGFEEVVL